MPVNVPNIITLTRLMVVPLILILLLVSDGSLAAALLFLLAASTDALDGHLARSRNEVTRFGTLLDPLVDKVLVGGALIVLAAVDRVEVWVVLVVIGREVAVSGLRWARGREGVVIAANAFGKLKMWAQVAAVTALIAASNPGAAWVDVLVYTAVALTLLSGLHYFLAAQRATRQRPSPVRVSEAG